MDDDYVDYEDMVKAPEKTFPNSDVRYGELILPGDVDWRESFKRESLRKYDLGNKYLSQNNTYMSLREFAKMNGNLSLNRYWIFEHYGRWFEYDLGLYLNREDYTPEDGPEFPVSDEFIEMVLDELTQSLSGGDGWDMSSDEVSETISKYKLYFQKAQDGKIYYFYQFAPYTDSETELGLFTQRKAGVYTDRQGDQVYYPRRIVPKLNQELRVKNLISWMIANKRPVDLVRADELHGATGENPTRITIYPSEDDDTLQTPEDTDSEDSDDSEIEEDFFRPRI